MNRTGAVETDHVVVEHLGKADAGAAGQFMAGRHHENETVAAEREGLQARMVDGAGDNADIAGALGDQPDDFIAEALLEIDADVRIGVEKRTERLRQELGQRIGIGQNPHLAGETTGIRGEVLLKLVGLRQDGPGVLQQHAPRLRRHNALPATHQQFGAKGLLKLADAGGSRRQRQIQSLGAMGNAASFYNMPKKTEVGKIEPHALDPATLLI